jgi:hypothetical protein
MSAPISGRCFFRESARAAGDGGVGLKVKAGEGRREWCFDFVHGTAKREREREEEEERQEKPSAGIPSNGDLCDGRAMM